MIFTMTVSMEDNDDGLEEEVVGGPHKAAAIFLAISDKALGERQDVSLAAW